MCRGKNKKNEYSAEGGFAFSTYDTFALGESHAKTGNQLVVVFQIRPSLVKFVRTRQTVLFARALGRSFVDHSSNTSAGREPASTFVATLEVRL